MSLTMERIEQLGYEKPHQLPDGTWCAIGRMLFTTGIVVDITEYGYDHRFCFEHYGDAVREMLLMKELDSEPHGYIKRKPEL